MSYTSAPNSEIAAMARHLAGKLRSEGMSIPKICVEIETAYAWKISKQGVRKWFDAHNKIIPFVVPDYIPAGHDIEDIQTVVKLADDFDIEETMRAVLKGFLEKTLHYLAISDTMPGKDGLTVALTATKFADSISRLFGPVPQISMEHKEKENIDDPMSEYMGKIKELDK